MRGTIPSLALVGGLTLAAADILPFGAAAEAPLVTVAQGQARGRTLGGRAVFKGLPFAATTAGDGRWRAPGQAPVWDGVRDASEFGPTCAQIDAGWNRNSAARGSEECL